MLGREAAGAAARRHARCTLAEGLAAGVAADHFTELAELLSAAHDAAALALDAGGDPAAYRATLDHLLLATPPPT